MNETQINWTELTWNPMSGCHKISTECAYCYAHTLAENKRGTAAFPNGFDLTIRPHKLAEPARVKAPSLIFCNSMSDPGLEEIPDQYRHRILDAIESAPRHRYQMLTKRPDVWHGFLQRSGRKLPDSVWMGVTVGHASTTWRVDELKKIAASLRFISAEPLLDLVPFDLNGIDWIIGGGESGTHASDPKILANRFMVRRGGPRESLWVPREDRIDWARNLRDRAVKCGTAFWWKQWGGPRPTSAGRMLDGVEHDGLPTHIHGAMPDGYDHRKRGAKHAEPARLPMVG